LVVNLLFISIKDFTTLIGVVSQQQSFPHPLLFLKTWHAA